MTIAPRSRRRAGLLASLALVVLLACWPTPAQAHARPVATNPADGQVLATAPASLTVTFDEPVMIAPAGNQLLDDSGDEIPAEFSTRDQVLTIQPEEPLGQGTHVVAWRVVSADAHPVAGGFTFSVGAPTATTVGVPPGAQQREVEVARAIATGLQYAGVLGLAGLVGFVVLVATSAARRDASLAVGWRRAGDWFAVLAIAGAVLLVPLTSVWEAGTQLSSALTALTWSTTWQGPTAVSSLLVLGGVATALLGLRRGRDLVALGGGATALAALVVVGHTRSYGPGWLVLAADLVHLAAGAIWWGGLVALGLALTARPAPRAEVRARLVARFSTMAGVAVAGLVVAGGILYWRIGYSVSGLWETGYGRTVLLKSGLVLPLLVLAWWNRVRLVPRIAAGDEAHASTTLARTVRIEALVLAAVVTATAVLVNQTPPARDATVPVAAPVEQVVEIDVGDSHRARVVVTPVRRGMNGVRVAVIDAAGDPVDLEAPPTLSFRLPGTSVGPLNRPLSRSGGEWEATADLPLQGTWEVTLAVPLSPFEEPVVTGRIEVP